MYFSLGKKDDLGYFLNNFGQMTSLTHLAQQGKSCHILFLQITHIFSIDLKKFLLTY